MTRVYLVLAVTVVSFILHEIQPVAGESQCPKNYQNVGGMCLRLYLWTKTFQEATEICQSNSGHLVTPKTKTSNFKFIKWMEDQNSVPDLEFWLGLSSSDGDHTFYWSDEARTPVSNTWNNWKQGFPRGRTKNCVTARIDRPRWKNVNCSLQLAFICQFEKKDLLKTVCAGSGNSSRELRQFPDGKPALCDTTTGGGGWLVIQQRVSGAQKFNKKWKEYQRGFGQITESTSFWIGLDRIHELCRSETERCELQIELVATDYEGHSTLTVRHYDSFHIEGNKNGYRLSVANYTGEARRSMIDNGVATNNGWRFTTKDRDNDNWSSGNCAVYESGGWWHNRCGLSNMNLAWKYLSHEIWDLFVEMKVRRVEPATSKMLQLFSDITNM